MFVRDALYKIEITDKVKLSNEEKLEGIEEFITTFLLSPSSLATLYRQIKVIGFCKWNFF